jgi:ribosomal protein S30
VRGQAPKVPKQEKKKKPTGRAMKRIKYNRRFVNVGEFLQLARTHSGWQGGAKPGSVLLLGVHVAALCLAPTGLAHGSSNPC